MKEMLSQNILYSETMELVLKRNNQAYKYEGMDPIIKDEDDSGSERSEEDWEDDDFTGIQVDKMTHVINKNPFPSDHIFIPAGERKKETKVDKALRNIYREDAI